ncbi:MAG: site-2 protease family protein [Phycisphaerales bacterium]|nr:site-2 protease family protein [Phycisphaerales bacterium]
MLLIILGFGLLIGIHELGHFLAAKWSGIRTNAFAIGMGPAVISYRKGIGFCFKSSKDRVIAKFGKDAVDMNDEELQQNGISETEYSFRLLPIGGFVSMLGQEDGKPDQVSDNPRSYNMCSIGKRMVVVSAGVIMNLVLAGVFFLICFQIGVNFEAPIVGQIIPDSPASYTPAIGTDNDFLKPGDTIVSVDGKPATSFTDIQIAGAMAKPGVPVTLKVKREGKDDLLAFSINPKGVTQKGLLELGLFPASSLTLRSGKVWEDISISLSSGSSDLNLLRPNMTLTQVESHAVDVWAQFDDYVQLSGGNSIQTLWNDKDGTLDISIPVYPELNVIRLIDDSNQLTQNFERGLLGLCPLTKVASILSGSANESVLLDGDVILKAGSLEYPRMAQLRNLLVAQPDGDFSMSVLRNGEVVSVAATIDNGKLNVLFVDELEIAKVANPLREKVVLQDGRKVATPTAVSSSQILGGSDLISVNGVKVNCWKDIRSAIVSSGNKIVLEVRNSTNGKEVSTVSLDIPSSSHKEIADLGWVTPISSPMFSPLYVLRSSGGNPVKALQMGLDETFNMVVMTYLTIDRLFRRSVGVDQLRGPIGIVHIGSKIADRGISYLLFFLAIISVNLAVLNFLPLPIVDGGLFLYLVYEKIFKKPPSIVFQNAAAVLGLCLIATLFVVTFYNDIARLVG